MLLLSMVKRKRPKTTLANIKRDPLLNSSNKNDLWCFKYQYAIWIYRQNENKLRGDVTYFLWNGTRPSYKHIKIWSVKVYIINGRATRNKSDYRSHWGYFMGYENTTRLILYWKPDQPFFIHIAHHIWFDEYNSCLSTEDKHNPG